MNIAIASPSASAYSETFIHMQMERLPCRLRIHGRPVATETIPGGAIKPLKSLRGVLDTILAWRNGTRWEEPQRREVARRLRRVGSRALLANYGPTGVALAPVCEALRIPLIVHFHGFDAHRSTVVEQYREAYRKLAGKCSKVVVVSNRMRGALAELGVPEEKMSLLRCGVDPERFAGMKQVPEQPVFFGVGRFVDKKAPYLTILAFKQVHDQIPGARLILAGDGMLLESARNIAKVMHIENAVEFAGVLSPAQVAERMNRSTAFVQHSITPGFGPDRGDSEGTPVAILEAMMSGLPVVSTLHAGIGEVVQDGATGFVVPERDVDGMAAAMLRLARSRDLAGSMGDAARKYAVAHHSSESYIGGLLRLIESATVGG